jgi:hypothetical protein
VSENRIWRKYFRQREKQRHERTVTMNIFPPSMITVLRRKKTGRVEHAAHMVK